MHLTHVEGNLKLGVDAELGPRVLVEGPNGSGKTSLVAAAELLLTGSCGGGNGRDPTKLPSRLVALATSGADALTLRGTLSDSSSVALRVAGKAAWSRNGKAVQEPIGTCLSTVLSDLLAGDPARTLRPELIRIACADVDVSGMVEDRIPSGYREVWDATWREVLASASSPADALAECARRFRAGMREANAGAKAVETATTEAPEEGEAPSAADLDEARLLVERARRFEQAEAQRENVVAEIARLRKLVTKGDAAPAEDLAFALAACEGASALQRFWENRGIESATCLACGGTVQGSDLLDLREKLERKAGAIHAAHAGAVEQIRVRTNLAALEEQRRRLPSLQEPSCTAAEAEEQLEALLRRKGAAESRKEMRRSVARFAQAAQAQKALSEATDAMVREALDGSVHGLEKRVNSHLRDGRIKFVLFEPDGRPACRVLWTGTVRKAKITAPLATLSGAQRADVVRSFACAWAGSSEAEVTFASIDDVGLDREHLNAILEGLDAADSASQAIVCNVDGYGIEREGWTNVRL